MKSIVCVLILFLGCIPALTGFVDIIWWFYTNHALSSIDWTGVRPLVAYLFAAIGFFVVMGLSR
jgi:hypothetical protein